MPMYRFLCRKHGPVSKILTPEKAKETQHCAACAKAGWMITLKRMPSGPNANAKETLDNGLMPRRLERPADAERLNKERSQAPKKG